MITIKICKNCNLELEINNFNKDKSKKDGYRNSCKECQKNYGNEYYILNKDNINKKNKKWKGENKELIKEISKKYYEDNKDYILLKSSIYFQENKDKIRETKREYYKNNKEIILNNKKEYIKNRKKTDKLYHLTMVIRSLIKSSFYNKNFNKPRTLNVIGCSYSEFKVHIESLFKDNMNWENYGEWHLDHKIPASWAKTEEELYKLNHYSNFQPMWAFDNQSKSNRFSN
jgi:hypothetical protein